MNCCRLLSVMLIALAGWCLPVHATPVPSPAAAPALRLHWLGLKQINADTNSTQFMKVWHLPETTALVSQTLDKLSVWPGDGATNAASQALRPLLDDLIASEFYLEVEASTNLADLKLKTQNSKLFLLALHLPAARENLWQTNLALAFTTLTGQKPVATRTGWQIDASHRYGSVEWVRHAGWTLIGVGAGIHDALPQFESSLPSATRHPSRSEDWLEASLAFFHQPPICPAWFSALKLPVSGFQFHVSGQNGEILTRGTVSLSQPWSAGLPAWDLPTNHIHGPLTSFTAVRGMASWLARVPAWQKLQIASPPDQFFCWAQTQPASPFATYWTAPLSNASNQLAHLSQYLIQNVNPWLAANGGSSLQWDAALPGIKWNGTFIFAPFFKPISVNQRDFVLGGLIPYAAGLHSPMPGDVLHAMFANPNVFYFQAEQTGNRIEDGLFITQALRLTIGKPQLPPKAAATLWLKNIEPLLGAAETQVSLAVPDQLTFSRVSTIGFTALELHLLADWLESPQFPCGLHTFLASPDQK